MPMIKRRTKIVSIRLLDEEYSQLKRLCEKKGARSVSDLARDAMFGLIKESSSIEGKVEDLDVQLSALREEVARLSRMVQA
jgi:predicted DNA-binding protein